MNYLRDVVSSDDTIESEQSIFSREGLCMQKAIDPLHTEIVLPQFDSFDERRVNRPV